jgi:hypothetical protein
MKQVVIRLATVQIDKAFKLQNRIAQILDLRVACAFFFFPF